MGDIKSAEMAFAELGWFMCVLPLIIFFGAGILISAAYKITGEGK